MEERTGQIPKNYGQIPKKWRLGYKMVGETVGGAGVSIKKEAIMESPVHLAIMSEETLSVSCLHVLSCICGVSCRILRRSCG